MRRFFCVPMFDEGADAVVAAWIPHLNIVLIAGNHDSPGRLEAPAPFLESFDAHAIGVVVRDAEGCVDVSRLVVPLHDPNGVVTAWCLAVPFLRVSDVPRLEGEGDAYVDGIALLYEQAQAHALSLRQPGQAIVALGHCHMAGGKTSVDSERRILIGGAEMLSSKLFSEVITYVALGHLHLAQTVGSEERIRYSGSPLPMSFAEREYPHQVLEVELDGEQLAGVTAIPVPRSVALLRVPDKPAPLAEVEVLLTALDLPDVDDAAMPYLEVRVLLDGPEPGLRTRIEAALAGKPVRLARIETSTSKVAAKGAEASATVDDLGRLDPIAIFSNAYGVKYGVEPDATLLAALTEILNAPEEIVP
jgi:exonuclease SbcD